MSEHLVELFISFPRSSVRAHCRCGWEGTSFRFTMPPREQDGFRLHDVTWEAGREAGEHAAEADARLLADVAAEEWGVGEMYGASLRADVLAAIERRRSNALDT